MEKDTSVSSGAVGSTDGGAAAVRQLQMPVKKKKGWLLFVIILAAVLFLVIIFSVLSGNDRGYMPSRPYIGTLYVEGTIGADETDLFGTPIGYQHGWTIEQIDQLISDDNNKGLIVFVNSPGGGVYESDELYLKLKEYQEATGNPLYAVMGSMAASGGYYISAPADKIVANRNTWTGSIGVTMGTYFDLSGFLSRYGISTTTITSGANKAMGSMTDPMTEEQRAIMQSLVDEAYDQFTGIIAKERNMDITRVKQLADGRIYTAKQALDLDLVDEIGTMEGAISDMRETYGLEDCKIWNLEEDASSFWGSFINGEVLEKFFALNSLKNGEVSTLMNFVEEKSQFPISYMYEGF